MHPPHRHSRRGAARVILAVALGLCLILGVVFAGVYFVLVRAPADAASRGYEVAKRIAADLDREFHLRPRITVGSREVVLGDHAALELATVSRDFEQEYTLQHDWAGSTKTLVLAGNFTAKAGYDLQLPLSLEVSPDGESVTAILPEARILSLEEKSESVRRDESGFWNWLTPEDREEAKNSLLAEARKSMETGDLRKVAEARLVSQIMHVIGNKKFGVGHRRSFPAASPEAVPSASPLQ